MHVKTARQVRVAERRTQAERRASTRTALIVAGRELFAERGYEAVSSELIVASAGVTRGALYHHFGGKPGLFAIVFEEVEAEIVARLDFTGLDDGDPLSVLASAADQFLGMSLESDVQQIAMLDGPSVLGWEEWHEIEARYGLGLLEAGLTAAIEAGQIRPLPVQELALVLLGGMVEAALLLARAEDEEAARSRSSEAIRGLLDGLRV